MDRYGEGSELGRGGFATVTESFDRTLRRMVATKTANDGDDRSTGSLLKEARLLAYLDHTGVVPVYDAWDGAYTMKRLPGTTLTDVIGQWKDKGAGIPVHEVLRIVRRVAETLANAHDKGVLHLDLKPGNVMLDAYGQVWVVDWGAAQLFDPAPYEDYLARGGEVVRFSRPTGRASGTPVYMPYEQLVGPASTLRPTADVFSFGVMLYKMLTRRRPFQRGRSVMEESDARFDEVPSLSTWRADVPVQIDALCRRMLHIDPGQRPQSFHEVIEALDGLVTFGAGERVRSLDAGEMLFEEGDAGDAAYHILSGEIEVLKATPEGLRVLARRGPGDIIGEMSLLSEGPRSASIRAVGPTRMAVIEASELERELTKVNPLVAHMVRSLCDRLREADRRNLEQSAQD